MARKVNVSFDLRQAESGFYYLHWREGRRTFRRSTRTKDLEAAKTFLAAWLKIDISGAPTCGELWDIYYRDHVLRKCAGNARHFFAWKKLERRFSRLRPAEVTRDIIAQHVNSRAPAKPTSVFVELRLLTASWNYGIKRRLIAPLDVPSLFDLDLPSAPRRRERWLRESEVDRLFEVAAGMRRGPRLSRIERFMRIALETAGRRHAILELTWDQVDFETRVVHLNPDGREQTSKFRASVPMSDALHEMLLRAYAERKSNLVLDHSGRLHWQLDKVAAEAGVKGVTAHVFRHTAATWLARKGVPLWLIAKVLGNSVEEIDRTYAKFSPDDLRDAVNLISSRPGRGHDKMS